MCKKETVYLFFSILLCTMPMSILDVTSDGINSWDQMGFPASEKLVFSWLDDLMHTFCNNFDSYQNKTSTNDSGCDEYYRKLKQR